MEKVDVLLYGKSTPSSNLLSSLQENIDCINSIVLFSGNPLINSLKEAGFSLRILDMNCKNEAQEKNTLISHAATDYVLFLRTDFSLEEDLIEELLEELEETKNVDVIYPNLIVKVGEQEKIVNFPELYGSETMVLHGLSVEDCLPESAVLVRRSLFEEVGWFSENYDDFDFYEYIYRNLKNMKLKLASVSYVFFEPQDSFVDTSYRSYAIRKTVLPRYDWKKEIFPFLSWDKSPEIAYATACTLIGNRLSYYYDFLNASDFYRRGLLEFHNQETLRQLIKAYVDMGLFVEAKKLISKDQGLDEKEIENFAFYIDRIQKLVFELEKAIEEGKLVESLHAIQEVVKFYSGAPIHNILGVLKWIEKKEKEAYQFFFKAVTMNPLNEDYLYNLSETAKLLNKQGEVIRLIERITG